MKRFILFSGIAAKANYCQAVLLADVLAATASGERSCIVEFSMISAGTISSRRTFLKSSAVAGAYLIGSRSFANSRHRSIIVIGAGAFGGWTALKLLEKGAKVTLLDAWGPGNSRSSSGGETRVIRATYGSGRIYTQMAAHALKLWPEYERRWNLKLFFRTGVLWMAGADDSYERAALPLMSEAGVRFEKLSAEECAKRWPQINFDGISWSVYEPESGYLAARRGCEAVLNAFIKQGGEYRQAQVTAGQIASSNMREIKLNSSEELKADAYVFACGPWLGKLFPLLAPTITPTRQEVFFFGTAAGDLRFTDTQLPVWSDDSKRDLDDFPGRHWFYGIPGNHWRGFKIADDMRGATIDPTTMQREVSPEGLAAARAYLRTRFPALADAPLVESRVCQYENSTDQNFILDHHPEAENVWIVGGGSGHGFKHGPAIGDMASDAVLGLKAPPTEFALSRLTKKSSS
ncbi:MAG TPA: FAD-dependent oxidoreductase [Terriglobales bacterium]|jgi:glycine/D-amino acid oxidase-like deaminating enzyme